MDVTGDENEQNARPDVQISNKHESLTFDKTFNTVSIVDIVNAILC